MNKPSAKKRILGLEGIKFLIGSGALVATITLWSLFSNQDRVSAMNKVDPQASADRPTSQLSLLLPPMPTLVPIQFNDDPGEIAEVSAAPSTLDLRSVSAPVVSVPNNSNVQVVQGSGGGASPAGQPASKPATSTGSS